jgi:2,4-dienoyl-CoA reductase-like NADH-dependent reductase (Old Yellow Enzyme family)
VSEQRSAYRHIWTPLRIGSITVKNRIVMTAMTSNYAEDHILSERHIAFYRERAKGGVGLMITEQRTLPYMIELVGDDKFFIGSDYPHAEGFTQPVAKARKALAKLSAASVDKVLGDNAVRFFGI